MPALASSTWSRSAARRAGRRARSRSAVTGAPARSSAATAAAPARRGGCSRRRSPRRAAAAAPSSVASGAVGPQTATCAASSFSPAKLPRVHLYSAPWRGRRSARRAQASTGLERQRQRLAHAGVVDRDQVAQQVASASSTEANGGRGSRRRRRRRRPGRWHRPTTGGRVVGAQRQQRHPGVEPVLGSEPGEAHLARAVAVDVGDGAAQPPAAAEVDVDVDARRGLPWVTESAISATGPAWSSDLRRSRQPSCPGAARRGATPCRASPSGSRPASRSRSIRSPTSHCPEAVELDRQPVGRPPRPRRRRTMLEPPAQELLDRVLEEGDQVRELDVAGRSGGQRDVGQGGRGRRGRGRGPGAVERCASKEKGHRGVEVAAVEGLQRVLARATWSLPPAAVVVEGVEQLPEGYGGWPRLPGRLVGARVGDHQVLGRPR